METKQITLTERDWAEIYYALDSKRNGPTVSGDREWQGHLADIMENIGPDGKDAVRYGVAPIPRDSFDKALDDLVETRLVVICPDCKDLVRNEPDSLRLHKLAKHSNPSIRRIKPQGGGYRWDVTCHVCLVSHDYPTQTEAIKAREIHLTSRKHLSACRKGGAQ